MSGRLRQDLHAMPTTRRSSAGSARTCTRDVHRTEPAIFNDGFATGTVGLVADVRGQGNTANAGGSIGAAPLESP
jgi:hypothetical protein